MPSNRQFNSYVRPGNFIPPETPSYPVPSESRRPPPPPPSMDVYLGVPSNVAPPTIPRERPFDTYKPIVRILISLYFYQFMRLFVEFFSIIPLYSVVIK